MTVMLQAYYILDELIMAGELQETSKKGVLRVVAAQVLPAACCTMPLRPWCTGRYDGESKWRQQRLASHSNRIEPIVEAHLQSSRVRQSSWLHYGQ